MEAGILGDVCNPQYKKRIITMLPGHMTFAMKLQGKPGQLEQRHIGAPLLGSTELEGLNGGGK